MSTLIALKNSIIFTFAQTTRDGYFRNETSWGFKISGSDYDSNKARWGKVEIIGPDVKHVKVGQYILIEPLKWTTAIEHNGIEYWRTAEPFVMGTTETTPSDII
ncbi:MAG: hypothetical protein ACRCZC_06765 [Culicoidibacterales bacterium]